MAYFIFLKYLRSLEEFRKNPLVKIPHKSPPTNFQSLFIFKNPIFIQKRIFLHFWPNWPSGQSAHPAFWPTQPTRTFFLLPHRSKVPPPSPAVRRRPMPPRLHPAMGVLPRAPHRIPRPLPLLPSSFRRVKHWLKSKPFHPINASNSSALTTPSPPSATIKGEAPRRPPPPLPLLTFPSLHA
jgi:hypothetical protein